MLEPQTMDGSTLVARIDHQEKRTSDLINSWVEKTSGRRTGTICSAHTASNLRKRVSF